LISIMGAMLLPIALGGKNDRRRHPL
jgi:hypothetical protein